MRCEARIEAVEETTAMTMTMKTRMALRGVAAAMIAAGLLTLAAPVLATLPQGHVERHGDVTVSTNGNTMTIVQTSQAAKLDWQRFDIGKDRAVRIEQPDRDAFLVNRVTGTEKSAIDGSLTANGRVYLVNPNGIVFGSDAKVDVGSLIATTATTADMTGDQVPTFGAASGDIAHSGRIVVRNGGVARLAGKEILLAAESRIAAPGGTVELDADDGRPEGAVVHMEMGSRIQAWGGRVSVKSGTGLSSDRRFTLGRVDTHDMEIQAALRQPYVSSGSRRYDGTRTVDGGIPGIGFTEDSTLYVTHVVESPEPGPRETMAGIAFRDSLGTVRVRSLTQGSPEPRRVTIESIPEAERRRIDLPVFKNSLTRDAAPTIAGKTMTVKQKAPYAVFDWSTFHVAEDHTVNFEHQASDWTTVNRITGSEGSRIHGNIHAVGSVYLFNPNGVLFSRTAKVDAGSLVVAGFKLEDRHARDAGAQWTLKEGTETARVENFGTITVASGGIAALMGKGPIKQAGVIDAPQGEVSLFSATDIGMVGRKVSPRTPDSGPSEAVHSGRTLANGGLLRMSGKATMAHGLIDIRQGQLDIHAAYGGAIDGEILPGYSISINGLLWKVPTDPDGGGKLEIAANRIAAWLDAGTKVSLRNEYGFDVFAPIHAVGTPDSALSVSTDSSNSSLNINADVRLKLGDLSFDAGKSVWMADGTTVAADTGTVSFSSKERLVLSKVLARDLALTAPLSVDFKAVDKPYDGTLAAKVDGETFSGVELLKGSNLRMRGRYRFESSDPGIHKVAPSEFAVTGFNGDRALRVETTTAMPGMSEAEIKSSGEDIARFRLPVLKHKRVEGVEGVGGVVPEIVGKTMTIRQSTPYLVLDWSSFHLAEDYTVNFEQQAREWIAVNRVESAEGAEGSRIHGMIDAKGSVYVFNPLGILFGETAKVNVGGLVGAGFLLNAEQAKQPDGTWSLTKGEISATVVNEGTIAIAQGGVATLVAPGTLAQDGTIAAPEGSIHLASAERVTLDREGKVHSIDGKRDPLIHRGTSSAVDGDITLIGGDHPSEVTGTVEAAGKGRIRLEGTVAGWNLRGTITPGASLLLSEVVFQIEDVGRDAALESGRITQWLNAGADVEIRREGQRLDMGSASLIAEPDARGTLTLTADPLEVREIRVPKLRLTKPLMASFEARSKAFDGTAEAQVGNARWEGVRFDERSNLRLRPTYRFASAEPGEHLVSAEVELVGFNGDDALPLSVVYDQTPDAVARRTARILPGPDVKPNEKPDVKPDGRPDEGPGVKPAPKPTPIRSDPPFAARAAIDCEARRVVARSTGCDGPLLAAPAAAASATALSDRGIRPPR